jgi:hypothetical protein
MVQRIRRQDAASVFQAVSANPVGQVLEWKLSASAPLTHAALRCFVQRIAWQFIQTNWDALYARFGSGGNKNFGETPLSLCVLLMVLVGRPHCGKCDPRLPHVH